METVIKLWSNWIIYPLAINILKNGIFIYTVNTFLFRDPSYLLKKKVIGFNWVEAARGGSIKINVNLLQNKATHKNMAEQYIMLKVSFSIDNI